MGTISYVYDITDGTGSITERSTDPKGNVTEKTRDRAGRLVKVVSGNSTTIYTYDVLNRLLSVTEPDGRTTAYEYDLAGNRLKETVTEGGIVTEIIYAYGSQNWLTGTTTKVNNVITKTTAYGYDRNGNQLTTAVTAYEDGEASATTVTISNTYDLRNQLIRTETADGTVVVCTYNGEGYRVTKEVTKAGAAKKTFFLYEGDKAVLELDGNGLQTGRNVYGTNLLFRTTEGTTYSYLYNGHGDVTALVTDSGEAAASYYYDAFGNITESTGTVDNSIRYAGYQYDVETGLYYINARMYDPLTARFLQEDTYTGNPKDPLSLNLYTYCHNDPVSYDDPTGHKRKNVIQKWVAKAKKAVKKTAEKVASTAKKAVSEVKKAVSTAKKEIKKTIAKEKARSKEAVKQYEKQAATVKVPAGPVDAKPHNYLEGGTGPQKTKTVQAKLEKTTVSDAIDGIQTVLDVAGIVPGGGEPFDALNAGIYLLRGDKANAILSGAACAPIGGQLATVGKFANKGAKAVKKADDVYDVMKATEKAGDVAESSNIFLKYDLQFFANKGGNGSNKVLGGSFKDVNATRGADEVGHHVAQDAYNKTIGISRNDGPAVLMTKEDHLLTRTYAGKGRMSMINDVEYSARERMYLDIVDIRKNFGTKYNQSLLDMIDYAKTLPQYSK